METLRATILAAVGFMLLAPVLGAWARRIRAVDLKCDAQGATHEVPRVGGLAILLPTLALAAAHAERPGVLALVAVGAAVALVHAVDDWRGLSPRVRLATEVLAAGAFLGLAGLPEAVPFPGGFTVESGAVIAVLGILWMAGAANALNMIDGADGVAGGQALVASSAFLLAGAFTPAFAVPSLGAPLLGGLGAFLVLNRPPARIHLGDAGSRTLGFLLAGLPLTGGAVVVPAEVFAVALVALLLPTLDALHAAGRRIAAGRSPFRGDRRHVHHRLLGVGMAPGAVALRLAAISALALACALPMLARPGLAYPGFAAAVLLVGAGLLRAGRPAEARPPVLVRPSRRRPRPEQAPARSDREASEPVATRPF